MQVHRPNGDPPEPCEPPPLLGSWVRLYAAVLLFLLALMTMFWCFQRAFTP